MIQVQLWCCLILAQVYHALQVEIAGEAGGEDFDVSLGVLIRLTPHWLAPGLSPLQQAVRPGQDIKLIRPNTRSPVQVPWIDPSRVVPLLTRPKRRVLLLRGRARSRSNHPGGGGQLPIRRTMPLQLSPLAVRIALAFDSKGANCICWSRWSTPLRGWALSQNTACMLVFL